MGNATRTCSKCGESKPFEAYAKEKSAAGGRRPDCKVCRSASAKAWYAANSERLASRARERRATNPEPQRAYDRERNKSEKRRIMHDHRVAMRRARIAGAPVDAGVTRPNLRKQYGDDCFYCGVTLTFQRITKGDPWPPNLATIDHVHPVSLGGTHTWDNVVLSCWTCNCSKRHSSIEEWSPVGA